MPYNNISAEVGYAYDTRGNLITNKTDVLRRELPDSDPRKGEPLYSIPDAECRLLLRHGAFRILHADAERAGQLGA